MLHESNQLHLENCKMGQKVESSYRVKKKEQRGEKQNILIGWVYIVNLVWGEKEQGGKYKSPELAEWIHRVSVSGPAEHLRGYERHLRFSWLAWHPWQEQLLLGTRKLFQHQSVPDMCVYGSVPHKAVRHLWMRGWEGCSALQLDHTDSGRAVVSRRINLLPQAQCQMAVIRVEYSF